MRAGALARALQVTGRPRWRLRPRRRRLRRRRPRTRWPSSALAAGLVRAATAAAPRALNRAARAHPAQQHGLPQSWCGWWRAGKLAAGACAGSLHAAGSGAGAKDRSSALALCPPPGTTAGCRCAMWRTGAGLEAPCATLPVCRRCEAPKWRWNASQRWPAPAGSGHQGGPAACAPKRTREGIAEENTPTKKPRGEPRALPNPCPASQAAVGSGKHSARCVRPQPLGRRLDLTLHRLHPVAPRLSGLTARQRPSSTPSPAAPTAGEEKEAEDDSGDKSDGAGALQRRASHALSRPRHAPCSWQHH